MNKYLVEILKIQSSIILPGLGALMVPSQKSGKVVFNPHLKFNDGSLAKYIAEKENIDEQEAQNKVAKFIREIEADLGKGIDYDMFEFGSFFKNKDGEVDFKMATKAGEKAISSKPVAATKSEKPVEKKLTSKKTEKKVAEKKSEDKKEEKIAPKKEEKETKNSFVPKVEKKTITEGKKEEKTTPVAKQKTENKAISKVVEKKEVAKEFKPETKQTKNTFIPPKTENKRVKEEAPKEKKVEVKEKAKTAAVAAVSRNTQKAKETIKETVKETKTIVEKEKKKRSKLPWIILLLLLLGLAAGGYFFKDKIMHFFESDHTAASADYGDEDGHSDQENGDNHDEMASDSHSESSENHEDEMSHEEGTAGDMSHEDEGQEDENVAQEENEIVEDSEENEVANVEEEEPAAVVSNGTNNGNYHLIGNAFGEKGNAETYVQKMNQKGYSAKILGRFDGLYLVSLKSYDSQADASNGRSSVSADASSAWVFKYPR